MKRQKSSSEKKKQLKKSVVSDTANESEDENICGENGADAIDSDTISPSNSAGEVSPSMRKVHSSANHDVPFLEQFKPDSYEDSRVAARELFELLISPVDIDRFFS